MLEWTTAEDGEKNKISDLNSYYYEMKINSIIRNNSYIYRKYFY